ncbi:amino-acid transporter subunit; membrane component of ABC superfamily [Mesorhizobium metallidurans STM 2683]|uniref:Amino-acid transporter subunit membrane component of ABC superfamily n=1 Tax=Mesorhizobium metallidurans STM 2683 TaxID=1297569 RepID=M5EW07_9HYPH|nr:amino acid ABC transporter permease [Mesorhizobium metallidurans]CCV08412.1 amino-acid transporter subunit; membrane component of ABC superfamily [Mesorhizobium metallidurans STM 2683]
MIVKPLSAELAGQPMPPFALAALTNRARETVKLLFGSPLNAMLTLIFGAGLFAVVPPMTRWLVLDAVLFDPDPNACRAASGACWSFIHAKSGQLLLGIYPFDERWRPALVCVLIIALLGWSVRPASWKPRLLALWVVALMLVGWLMGGGFGLASVPTSSWGGLPVTLILTVVAIGVAFPAGILLALGRRSTTMPAMRIVTVAFIEGIRGLPLLSILYVASIMLPLFLPDYLLPDKFVRALIALTLFASAYLAEVIRGGLQAVPTGQNEAAQALGLSFWQTQRLVVLPQAIQVAIPALANTIIVMIKNTSLVLVVGLFDLISSGKATLADPAWPSPAAETFLFVGAIFFALSFSFARFSDFLERRARVRY